MAELEMLGGVAQTEVIVIPIIDVSGSMHGARIDSVNQAMREVPAQLADINDESIDAKLLIAPIEYSTGARWFALENDMPAEVESFTWVDLKTKGSTDFGAALDLLTEKLTTVENGGWMKGRGGAAPVLILISDGRPTDSYKNKLKELKKRGWFDAALKFAVAVEGADISILSEFTGHSEAIIDTTTIKNDLSSIVKAVIVSASKTASKSASVSNLENTTTVVVESETDLNEQVQKEAISCVKQALTLDSTDDLF